MAAARTERALVVLLLGLAGLAWWTSADRMEGMDAGPWTTFGALGWFLGVWAVMMAAMMLPSAIPTVALYGWLAKDRTPLSALLFVSGYLGVWAAAGLAAFAVAAAGSRVAAGVLAWDRAGRWAAGTTLLLAAAYQLTPSRTPASPGAARHSPSCSARGDRAGAEPCGWEPRKEPGASAAAGH